MKTLMVLATLGLTGFVGTTGAYAADRDRGRRHEPEIHVRHREPAPRFERCWIAPRYERVAVGVDVCGQPLFRLECVQPGYWGIRSVHCD